MVASALMQLGSQAVNAAYRQVQTTANNIANANVEGYSRQEARLATTPGEFTGSGWLGRGVTVSTILRAQNQFLTQQTQHLTAAAGTDAARANLLGQLEQVFGKTDTGLGHAANQIYGAMTDLAAAPSDLSARQAVMGTLEDFASMSRSAGAAVDALQAQTAEDIRNGVAEVNSLASSVAQLNVQIANALINGHQPNDLMDQRDQIVKQLSSQLELNSVTAADGQMALFMANGETLVLGNHTNTLLALPDIHDSSRVQLGVQLAEGLSLMNSHVVGEGRLAGLMQFQNEDLVAARSRLGQLVSAVAGSLNAQQQRGLDLNGSLGSALFTLPAPQVVPSSRNATDAAGQYISSVSLEVVDAQALQASEYTLKLDPGGSGLYQVTRLSDGQVNLVGDGDELDGMRITIGAVAPSAGESFRLKPVAQVAQGLELALRNPLGLAAANPVTASAANTNTGTVAVTQVVVQELPAAGSWSDWQLSFTDDSGSYDLIDGSGTVLTSGSFSPGTAISHDGLALTLSGVPKAGDLVQVRPTVHVAASNGNALALQQLGEALLVGQQQTSTDAFAALLSDVGVRALSATNASTNSGLALQRASTQLAGEVGVNLDEEAARLIQFQQSYQASAKILQTAQSMFDTLLQLVQN